MLPAALFLEGGDKCLAERLLCSSTTIANRDLELLRHCRRGAERRHSDSDNKG